MSDLSPSTEPEAGRSVAIIGLALAAAGVAAYLAFTTAQQSGLPVGCGETGGCAEVLRSKWATVFGVSVTYFALPVYLLIAIAGWNTRGAGAQAVLIAGSAVLLLAAAWFIGIQATVIKAWCPWCLAEHCLGILLAAAIGAHLSHQDLSIRPLNFTMLGAFVFSTLAMVQIKSDPPQTTIRRAGDFGTQVGAIVQLLDGKLTLDGSQPYFGASDATSTLYVMFDYCCPHCRRTHGYLQEAMQRYPQQLRVVCLPMPRDSDCNPEIVETESRFENACELATLALNVWELKPERFAEFDRWLFESPKPRDPTAALEHAKTLVDDFELQLNSPKLAASVERRLQLSIAAFNASGVQYLPVLMAPGMETVVGRPESEDAIMNLIEDELFTIPAEQ